jgi:hypothetical protein
MAKLVQRVSEFDVVQVPTQQTTAEPFLRYQHLNFI